MLIISALDFKKRHISLNQNFPLQNPLLHCPLAALQHLWPNLVHYHLTPLSTSNHHTPRLFLHHSSFLNLLLIKSMNQPHFQLNRSSPQLHQVLQYSNVIHWNPTHVYTSQNPISEGTTQSNQHAPITSMLDCHHQPTNEPIESTTFNALLINQIRKLIPPYSAYTYHPEPDWLPKVTSKRH